MPNSLLDPWTLAALPAMGIAAGILGGLLGIGGGLVIIPALLILLGQPFGDGSLHVFKLAALLTAVVLSAPAAREHLRSGMIVPRMLPTLEVFGVLGVILGVLAAAQLTAGRTIVLQRVFGATMIAFVAAGAWLRLHEGTRGQRGVRCCPAPSRRAYVGLWVGLPAGIVGGLLGIGGGVWAVPVQNRMMGIDLRRAVANSTCMILGLALSAAVFQAVAVSRMPGLHWLDGVWLALLLAPGAVVGGALGGRLVRTLPLHWLRAAFELVLVLTGLRLAFG